MHSKFSGSARVLLRFLVIAGASLVQVKAGEFWERKEASDWTNEQVYELLTDSPWAHQVNVALEIEKPSESGSITWRDLKIPGNGPNTPEQQSGSPVGGIGAGKPKIPKEAKLLIRWSSAAPVRDALVRYKSGKDGAIGASSPVESESFYVIEVLGVPAIAAFSGLQILQDQLYRSAALVTRSGRTIRAESVYATPQGGFLGISIRFPKKEPLTLDDKFVDCTAKTLVFSFRRRFELRPMMHKGKLEL